MKGITALCVIVGYLAALVACVYGFVHNIVILATHFDSMGLIEILVRIVGIFAFPLGILLGYM